MPSGAQHTPGKRLMPVRVAFASRNGGYDSSVRSSVGTKALPREDSFLHDITAALEYV